MTCPFLLSFSPALCARWAQMKRLQACLDQRLVINQLQLSLGHSDLIWNGVVFNTGSRQAGGETLDDAGRLRVQVQAWGPLDRGKWTSGLRGSETRQSKVSEMVFRIATERGTRPESVVLAWLLRHPAKIQPVIGTANPDRIRACSQADQVRLTREEWHSLLVAARGRQLP